MYGLAVMQLLHPEQVPLKNIDKKIFKFYGDIQVKFLKCNQLRFRVVINGKAGNALPKFSYTLTLSQSGQITPAHWRVCLV